MYRLKKVIDMNKKKEWAKAGALWYTNFDVFLLLSQHRLLYSIALYLMSRTHT